MRVLQAAAWYPPYSLGGTEVYLEGLVDELGQRGVECSVVVPRLATAPAEYVHGGANVATYPVGALSGPMEIRNHRAHEGFEQFVSILEDFRGSIYHQHSWTRGCGLLHLQAARDRGLKTVVTVHVPGSTCMRGTMMLFGETACRGEINQRTCAACYLTVRGLKPALARTVAQLPSATSRLAARLPGSLMTALATPYLVELRRREVKALFETADRIVAVCQWLADVLRANGIPEDKLVLSRQGVPVDLARSLISSKLLAEHTSTPPLRLVYLGRIDPTKGLHVLLNALLRLPPSVAVTLTIHGLPPSEENERYAENLYQSGAGDPRIHFEGPLTRDEVPDVLRSHDVLCIPSQWMETGPLVALEAAAAGLHVLGSDLGGIRELVSPGHGGTLVPPGDVAAWSRAIQSLVLARAAGELSVPSEVVRTMADAADDMTALYRGLL